MIRCRQEVIELTTDKKSEDSRELPVIAPRRLSFQDVLRRDEASWRRVDDPAELRRIASRVQRELRAGELEHFIRWVCRAHGVGMARAAGLPIAPLRAQLAS